MKQIIFLCSLFLLFFSSANATLIDRGGGLIYDTDQDITWLQDANYAGTTMYYEEAVEWVDQLVYGGFSDWRLPNTVDERFSWIVDGETSAGSDVMLTEIGYMFYINLGNEVLMAPDGTYYSPPSWNSSGDYNRGPFVGLYELWTGTTHTYPNGFTGSCVFDPDFGDQYIAGPTNDAIAWAVHDGDIGAPDGDIGAPVPEPATMLLFGLGLLGLAGVNRKRQ